LEWTVVCTLRRGRIFLLEYYWDHADALEAVGMPEIVGKRKPPPQRGVS
jgi:hypothetical protein